MAIKYVRRPFVVKNSVGSSATLTEETGTSSDGRIIAVRTVTDDGAGSFIDTFGTVVYASKQVQLKVVSFDRTASSYKSDYDNAAEFERTVGDGEASGSSSSRKGGAWSRTVLIR